MANFDNIIQEINTNLPNNTTQAITAAKLRTTLIDLTNQIDTVQDDFESDVNEAINNISSSVTDLSNSIRFETNFPFELGSVNNTNGGLVNSTTRVRTPKFNVNDTGSNTVLANFDNSITNFTTGCFYNGDDYVRAVNSSEIQINYVDGTIKITPGQSLVSGFDSAILAFRNSDSTVITQSELDNCYLIGYTQMKDVVESNTSDITDIQGDITDIQGDITDIQGDIQEIGYLENQIQFEYGSVNSNTGTDINNTIRIRSKYTPISGEVGYIYFSINVANGLYYSAGATYNYNSQTESYDYNSGLSSNKVNIDNGVLRINYDGTYDTFRIALRNAANSEISEQELSQTYFIEQFAINEQVNQNTEDIAELYDLVNSQESPYYGLKYCALGDSITYGFIPRNYTGYPGQLDSYAKLASQKLGMTFVNNGISGSTLAVSNPDSPSTRSPMVLRYTDCPDDADVISVMGGTNDIRNGVQLGTMSDRVNTTYYGALHILLGGLYKKYLIDQGTTVGKTKKIIICTPPKLLASSGNVDGGTGTLVNMDSWCDAIKEVAAYYSIPVLDFQNLSGINPHLNQTIHGTDEGYTKWYNPYITDGTHPTQEGAEIMSDVLVGFLKGLK